MGMEHGGVDWREGLGRLGTRVLVGVGGVAVFLPLVLTLYLSVFDETLISFPPKGYTLDWYARILPTFGGALRVSLVTALVATGISLLAGVPAAIGLSRHRFRGRDAVGTLLLAPLTIPGVAIGLGIVSAVMTIPPSSTCGASAYPPIRSRINGSKARLFPAPVPT